MRVLAWPIDTGLNPYTTLLYESVRSTANVEEWPGNPLKKYAVWHMHWPDALLNIRNPLHAACKVSGMFAAADYVRMRGTKIIWTMHNFHSHEALHPALEPWFWRHFIPRVDGAISLSAVGLSQAVSQFPRLRDIPTTVIPHGHYRAEYPSNGHDARSVLGIPADAKVIMFFGAVRTYKNVDVLIRAFRKVRTPNALLYVVGQPNSSQLTTDILRESSLDSRVRVKFEFVKSHDVATYLSAADLVVLPYRDVLNSGSALLALSCNRPILVPERGSMGELLSEFSEAWVRTFGGQLDETILESALDWAQRPRPAVCPMPQRYNWNEIGLETVRFYERVLLTA
jgi:beta-1,4-mannosyltransferase